ncbi:MAG: CapA family protein [Ruminococcaceae bacterium]|nr:CapA family protein [Oscillospiraceae bacterium]
MNKEKTAIVFTGDIGFDRYMDHKWEDEQLLSQPILDFFDSADHTVANVEGAVMDIVNDGSRGAYFHTMVPKITTVLNKMHADIWNIGNNHIMDAGKDGIISTKAIAAQNGAFTIGAGLNLTEASEPVYLDEAGGIGMFCTTYISEESLRKNEIIATETLPGIFRWDAYEHIAQRISEVKAKCRWCVVVCHGGEEFACMPSPYTRERYMKYLELGADVVVAHHPHVPENYELFDDGKAIFYSLGNFIFDTDYQRAHQYTDNGVLLKLIFTEEKMSFEAMGVKLIRGEQRIVEAPLPYIFDNITAEDYENLVPLAVKSFIAEEKRRMVFLNPEIYTNATLEVWNEYFLHTEPEGYFAKEHMDFSCLVPLAERADEGACKERHLKRIKEYIISLL